MSRFQLSLLAAGTLLAASIGVGAQRTPSPGQPTFFWAITACGVAGLLVAVMMTFKSLPSAARRLALLALTALLYRVAYFPLMVFAGFVAALAESLLGSFFVWPTFLAFTYLANFGMAACVAVALGAPLSRWGSKLRDGGGWMRQLRWAFLVAAGSQVALATTVSLTTADDFRWLPDRPRPSLVAPPISMPVSNPYGDPGLPPAPGWAGSVLRLAARSTYALVPTSPWSTAVKGTLESLTRACPVAGSDQRLIDHHLAYLAAHPLLTRAR